VGVGRTPGTAEQPARRIERLVERLAKCNMKRKHRCLTLRLSVTAHCAIGDDPPILEAGERRLWSVEWTAAGRDRFDRLRIKVESGAAVLHDNACSRQHTARTELPIKRLDVGDDDSARIRGAHPDGIAFAVRHRPSRCLLAIDLLNFGVEKGWLQK